MKVRGAQWLKGEGEKNAAFNWSIDLRYFGQQNEVGVIFEFDPRKTRDAAAIRAAFAQVSVVARRGNAVLLATRPAGVAGAERVTRP